MRIRKIPYTLKFNFPAGTSRGILQEKTSWFIHYESEGLHLFGECGLLKSLSIDDRADYDQCLELSIQHFRDGRLNLDDLEEWPSIRCGWEMLLKKIASSKDELIFDSPFYTGAPIEINGLIWMGDFEFMKRQIKEKVETGFSCIKMKIGAIDFEEELRLMKAIRNEYNSSEMEIRVDANGAFQPSSAMERLNLLSALDIHSIEQPIAAGQWQEMAQLCTSSPIPIALDEELISLTDESGKKQMMETIRPKYIILKPSLIGGFQKADEWIELAEANNCKWWATSALESNIGLNAIAQWCSTKKNSMPQGLGTGSLYSNNIHSPLIVENGLIRYDKMGSWDLSQLIDA